MGTILNEFMKIKNFHSHFASPEYIILSYVIAIYLYFVIDLTTLKHNVKETVDGGGGFKVGYSYPPSLKNENARLAEACLAFSWIGLILFVMYWIHSSTNVQPGEKKMKHAQKGCLFLILSAFTIYLSANVAIVSSYAATGSSQLTAYQTFQGLPYNTPVVEKGMEAGVIIGFVGLGLLLLWHWVNSIWGPKGVVSAAKKDM